jgi:hypothetical protein
MFRLFLYSSLNFIIEQLTGKELKDNVMRLGVRGNSLGSTEVVLSRKSGRNEVKDSVRPNRTIRVCYIGGCKTHRP